MKSHSRTVRVVKDENGNEPTLVFGWVIKAAGVSLISAAIGGIALALLSVPALKTDAKAQKKEVESLQKSQHVIVSNQRVIDEEVRNLKADQSLANGKLDEVLVLLKSTKQFKRPAVENSRLKDPEDIK